MTKYWIVNPECYDFINDLLGSVYSKEQINDMKKICKNGIYVIQINIAKDNKYKYQYNNISILVNRKKSDWMFQQEFTVQSIRKFKLKKINETTLSNIS